MFDDLDEFITIALCDVAILLVGGLIGMYGKYILNIQEALSIMGLLSLVTMLCYTVVCTVISYVYDMHKYWKSKKGRG